MKKHPELTAQTRENLTEAFWSLYTEKPADRVTVKEIAERAGYNRSTFYEYFLDVKDVLEKTEESLLPGPEDFPPLVLEGLSNPLPVDNFIRMFERRRRYYQVLFGDNGDPSFQSRLKNAVKTTLKKRLISQGTHDDSELDFLLEYVLSAMIGVLSYWFRLQDPPPADRLMGLMYDLMQHGVMHRIKEA
jgi:AcrR family transcriptional regulator